jgi:aspartyl-tRNA(Asn)/glutamyl-tRNA(Gln) amidotransferase subunit C
MKLSTEQVKKVAKLANLPVTEKEEALYADQLSAILDYIDLLNSVDTKNVDPTFNIMPEKNIMRKDEATDSLSQEDAVKNASNKRDGYFVTKGVFAEE